MNEIKELAGNFGCHIKESDKMLSFKQVACMKSSIHQVSLPSYNSLTDQLHNNQVSHLCDLLHSYFKNFNQFILLMSFMKESNWLAQ